jgi:SDR family mycofactocin-dependent oxidoreductase
MQDARSEQRLRGGRLEGRVALVTGAAGGQGRSHAVRLAEEGAHLVVTDLEGSGADGDGLAGTAAAVEALGRRVVSGAADVRDEAQLRELLATAVGALGRLDIVVANAGVVAIKPSLEEDAEEGWRRALDVNLGGVWHTARAALPHLIAGGRGGSIVITGSTQAFKATPGVAAYAASKTGTIGLMRTLAVEFAEHMIRVNSVHPTTVWTPMLAGLAPAGLDEEELRAFYLPVNALPVPWVEAVDVSNAVVFLASDEARYVTGASLPVDAGALLVGGRPGSPLPAGTRPSSPEPR